MSIQQLQKRNHIVINGAAMTYFKILLREIETDRDDWWVIVIKKQPLYLVIECNLNFQNTL